MSSVFSVVHSSPSVVSAIALCVALCGCGGRQTTILESDVPAPQGFEVRFSDSITREGDTLTGGRFLLSGEATDVERLASEVSGRYHLHGWRLVDEVIERSVAQLSFTKDERTARVEIDARQVAPPMSVAIVTVSTAGAPDDAPR